MYGGPTWLDYDRYEVIARTKPGTRPEMLRLMLQGLLADRFRLSVKPDTRQVPGFVLSKGKGAPKLKAASDGSSGGCRSQFSMGMQILQCRHVTMAEFAQTIRGRLSPGLNKLPVMDSTGLEGAWDFDLETPVGGTDGASNVMEAVAGLGLKIEKGSVPQPVLVVESVNRQPVPNPPGLSESLPAPPAPVFEVASLKPCDNNNGSTGLRFEAGGRVTGCGFLAALIQRAWNLPLYVDPVGLPKSMADQRLSIVAKAPAGVAPDPQHNAQARATC